MTPQHGQCFNCDEHVGEESYCHGCETFVCSACAVNYSTIGGHDADEHLIDVDALGLDNPEDFEEIDE